MELSNSTEKYKLKHKDAYKLIPEIIRKWKPASQVWSFTYGNKICEALSAGSAAYITHFIRKELKLRPYARISCYAPMIALPIVFTEVMQSHIVDASIIDSDPCYLCTFSKAAVVQSFCGVVYPLILGHVIGFYLSDRLLTYPVPTLTKAPMEVLNIGVKMIMKYKSPLLISTVLQVASTVVIAFEKQRFMWNFVAQNASH